MRKHLWAVWLVSSAALFLPALAQAEDEPKPYPECTKAPTDSETAAAKGAYQAGNASFDEADYPRALTYWEDAYRRDCTANLLLKNLARAYELYGQKRQAVVALETFLVREPSSSDKEQIQRRIEVLKKQIAAEKAAPPAGGPTPAAAMATTPPPPPAATTEPTPVVMHKKRSFVPLIVAGAGAVVTVIGVAVYAGGSKDVNKYEALCPNRMCTGPNEQADANGGEAARKKKVTGAVVTGVGVAGIAGGLIWYFVQPTTSNATASAGTLSKPRVNPELAPGFAGLALSGAF
jgi:tetratricopeptide (TPR) repeat protein